MGFRHILIESGNEIRTLPGVQFRGVQVSIRELVISGGLVRVYIDLLCREPAGYHIFNSIGGEIAQKVSEMSQDSDLIEVITVILKNGNISGEVTPKTYCPWKNRQAYLASFSL